MRGPSEYGNYQNNKIHHNNLYADALLSINKSFFDDKFSLSFNLSLPPYWSIS